MKGSRKLVGLVVVVLGVAALLFALRSCSADEGGSDAGEADPSASASASPAPEAVKMSTTKIEQAIKARLDVNAGEATVVECPDSVSQKVGTEFTCDVFFEAQPGTAAAATAEVEIDGPDGHYSWTSTTNQGG